MYERLSTCFGEKKRGFLWNKESYPDKEDFDNRSTYSCFHTFLTVNFLTVKKAVFKLEDCFFLPRLFYDKCIFQLDIIRRRSDTDFKFTRFNSPLHMFVKDLEIFRKKNECDGSRLTGSQGNTFKTT